jgi:hypothetical protein
MALDLAHLRTLLPSSASPVFNSPKADASSTFTWCLNQHTQRHSPMPVQGGRNTWLTAFAFFCNERGVPLSEIEPESIQRWESSDFTHSEIRTTIAGIYRREIAKHGSRISQLDAEHNCFLMPEEGSPLACTPTFPCTAYEALPNFLRQCTHPFNTAREKDVVLTGALTVISGCFPQVHGEYDGAQVGANLYSFTVAPAASGKGALAWAYKLAAPYHSELVTESRLKYAEYNQALEQHQLETRASRKNPGAVTAPSPLEPPFRQLFIPANSSSAGIIKALADNEGRGIIFDTEADTLSDALKQDYGDFSHLLRKAFHHEPCPYQRKTNREYYCLENPALSVALAGTPGQLRTLIPSAEDGLKSRFLFYGFAAPAFWRDVSPNGHRDNLSHHFDALGQRLTRMIHSVTAPATIRLTDAQWSRLNATGTAWVNEADDDAVGVVKRLGLSTFRIAMVLTIVRTLESGRPCSAILTCTDEDFETSLQLAEVFRTHGLLLLSGTHSSNKKRHSAEEKAELISKARTLQAQGHKFREISQELGVSLASLHRWLS